MLESNDLRAKRTNSICNSTLLDGVWDNVTTPVLESFFCIGIEVTNHNQQGHWPNNPAKLGSLVNPLDLMSNNRVAIIVLHRNHATTHARWVLSWVVTGQIVATSGGGSELRF